ncbi:MAG: rod shape-determining protein RodA [Candidatus Margulisbacteria bacterium]|nr:rod shape-determining protein RodA [Candidatus Margulisiibacteriota bacterium]
MINFRMLKLSDPWLWSAVGALILISLLAIFSCTHSLQIKFGGDAWFYVKRQLLSLLVGAIGLGIFTYFDYKQLQKAAPFLYGIMIILLGGILFMGGVGGGAQRWFQLGPLSFQPSELSKIIMVIALAAFFSQRQMIKGAFDAGALLIMVGLPFLLIFKQPDLGTALVFIIILIGMLTASWASPKLLVLLISPMISALLRPILIVWLAYLVALIIILFLSRASLWDWLMVMGLNIAVGIAVPFIWGMLKSYQQQRIVAFLNPGSDPQGAGYHSLQSKIAMGSGGLFGRGFLRGSQTQLHFIPEQHSDFIFSVIGEEFGFIGTAVVLSLFAVIIWRAFVIAAGSPDLFGQLLASGIAVMTGFHVVANVGMTLGLLPVVGMPLPFVSFGGSSLLVNMMALGILQSICMRRQKILF